VPSINAVTVRAPSATDSLASGQLAFTHPILAPLAAENVCVI
jgi:hypothetical protein